MKEAKRYVIRNSYDGKFYNGKNTFKPGIFGELEKANNKGMSGEKYNDEKLGTYIDTTLNKFKKCIIVQ